MIETQFGRIVKKVRTDNGLELTSYGERGIVMELSCAYTPQQNGLVERKHRYILEMARALRFLSGLPV